MEVVGGAIVVESLSINARNAELRVVKQKIVLNRNLKMINVKNVVNKVIFVLLNLAEWAKNSNYQSNLHR